MKWEPPGHRFDVLVLGSGIAGATLAAHLSGRRKVAILERELLLGSQTTGRSAAMFLPSYGGQKVRPLTRASRGFFNAPPKGFDARILTPRAALHIARTASLGKLHQLAAELATARALTREQARALVPILRPSSVAAGLLETDAGDLDVASLHSGFLRACRETGGVTVADVGDVDIRRLGSLWRVRTGKGDFLAPVLVNAAGAWADATAQAAGLALKGLGPLRRTVLLTDPPAKPGFADWPTVKDINERFYFRPYSSSLLVTACDETPSPPCDAQADIFDVAYAVARFEFATSQRVRRVNLRWAGLRTFAPDRAPVIGWSEEAEGFFWLAGLGGVGIQTSPAVGRLAASILLRQPTPSDLIEHGVRPELYAPSRFRGAGSPVAVNADAVSG